MDNNFKNKLAIILAVSIITSTFFGASMGYWAGSLASNGISFSGWVQKVFFNKQLINSSISKKVDNVQEESAVISAVEKVSPAVVSVTANKEIPVYQEQNPGASGFFKQFFGFDMPQSLQQNGTENQEVSSGTGFLISADGYIVTNKHVVYDEDANYEVLMNDGSQKKATVLARDPITDLAILKIDGNDYPYVEFGNSSNLKVGQTVIAIGNSLGEFTNTVSTGVISGLSRSIVAGGDIGGSEQLSGVIQTDASINPGNSGGPLLNIDGQVIGINTAIAEGAQNVGFAIPINEVRNTIETVKKQGKIIRPWLGIRYVIIDKQIAEENNLKINYGALIIKGQTSSELAVVPGSPADKAGLVENDIILEVNGKKIDENNPLNILVAGFKPGDEVDLKISHKGEEKNIKVKLEEMEEN